MPLPPRDVDKIGPTPGERFPDVQLPDQTGTIVDLHAARAGRPAVVVFYRSAEWWPFCKTQLVQLQQVLPTLREQGIALFAVSYDAVEILAAFAAKHGIAYPLLSDQGSHVMRRLGLINERVQEDHAFYGIPANPRHVNLPYPGTFVLDRDGVITSKRFYESYRVRDTGAGAAADLLGLTPPSHGPEAGDAREGVRVRAWLDSPTYAFFQRLRLTVELVIDAGLHVYGRPVPDGNVPVTIDVAPIDGLEVGAAQFPPPHRMTIEGLDDEFWVYEGTLRVAVPLIFGAAPGGGDHVVRVTVTFQACSDSSCALPASVPLALPVTETALAERSLPAAKR